MNGSCIHRALACGTAMVLVFGCAVPAIAQPAPPADNAEAGVNDIIVTARKSSENLRDVPVAITAVSAQQLTEAKIAQIGDLTSRIPQLVVSYSATQPFVLIRGFGTGNSQSFDQAVGKFIDNVSYGRDQDARLPLFDVERVEVLKGPQVLLFGNSSTAGALNITTRKPGDEFEADGSASYEFYHQEVLFQGGMTLPISEGASLRVSGMYQDLNKGPNFNVATGKHVSTDQNYAARGILRLNPTDAVEIMLKAEYDHIRNKGMVGEPVAQPLFIPPIFGYQFPEVNYDGRINSDNSGAPLFGNDFQALNNQTYQMDVNADLLGGTLTSTSAYRDLEMGLGAAGGQDVPLFTGYIGYRNKQFSQELRFAGKYGDVDILFGGFYQREKRDNITVADFNAAAIGVPLPPFALNLLSLQKTKSYSGFGDITYHLTDAFSIEAGARYAVITRDADQSALAGNVVPNKRFGQGMGWVDLNPALDPVFFGFFGVTPHSFSGLHLRETHFQPQVIAQYKVNSHDQVYAKFVKGDKAGGFDVAYQGIPANPATGTPVIVEPEGTRFLPEKAESFEIGYKGITPDRKLSFALAAFYTTFTNLQTNAYVGSATVAVVANVGKARSKGFEWELNYAPVDGLRLGFTGAFTDAKYKDFPGGACTRQQDLDTILATGNPFAVCVQDLSGHRTPMSSRWVGTFSVDYEKPVGDLLLGGGIVLAGRSHYNTSSNDEPLLEQKGYVTVEGHLDVKAGDGQWTFSLFGRNLTDKRYNEYGSISPGTKDGLLAFPSKGRQIGIRAGFNF
jgi:iron complex outermembrane receptor protein